MSRYFRNGNFPTKARYDEHNKSYKIRNTSYKKGDKFLAQNKHSYELLEIESDGYEVIFRGKVITENFVLFRSNEIIHTIGEDEVVMKVNPNDNIDVEKQVRRFLTKKTGIMPRVAATKAQVSKLTQLEEKINKEIKAIRVQGLLKKRKESLEDFLILNVH